MRTHGGRIVAAMVTSLALALPAAAETDDFIETTKMSETQRSAISHSGVVLIEGVADARSDIADRDYRRAQREVRQARRLCEQIADASPSLRLRSSFIAALQSIDPDAKKPAPQLDPIYRQLDAYEKVVEDTEIRTSVDRARSQLESGEIEAAEADLEEASEKIRYFEVDLPIDETYQLLVLAEDDLDRGEPLMADSRLRKVQGSLKTFAEVASLDVDQADLIDVAAPPPGE
jgi:hypothetical protein